jgi:hypothetical protein
VRQDSCTYLILLFPLPFPFSRAAIDALRLNRGTQPLTLTQHFIKSSTKGSRHHQGMFINSPACFWARYGRCDALTLIGLLILSSKLISLLQSLHSRGGHDVINHGNYLYRPHLPCRGWLHCLWQEGLSTLRTVPSVTLLLQGMSTNGLEPSQVSLRHLQGFQGSTKQGFTTCYHLQLQKEEA